MHVVGAEQRVVDRAYASRLRRRNAAGRRRSRGRCAARYAACTTSASEQRATRGRAAGPRATGRARELHRDARRDQQPASSERRERPSARAIRAAASGASGSGGRSTCRRASPKSVASVATNDRHPPPAVRLAAARLAARRRSRRRRSRLAPAPAQCQPSSASSAQSAEARAAASSADQRAREQRSSRASGEDDRPRRLVRHRDDLVESAPSTVEPTICRARVEHEHRRARGCARPRAISRPSSDTGS